MRLNNLCAQGAYSGVYWNDGSFQEFSYVTGADSAEMGQGGMRVNMVPKDGGNSFHGVVFGNYSPSAWASDNCDSPGVGQPCTRTESDRRHDLQQAEQLPHQRQRSSTKNYDINPASADRSRRTRSGSTRTFRYWASTRRSPTASSTPDPSPFTLHRRT